MNCAEPFSNFCFTLNKDGIVVLYTWDTDMDESLGRKVEGKYEVYFSIPPVLGLGTYTISISSGRPNIGTIEVCENCLSFRVENKTENGASKSFTRGGLIIPQIHWTNRRIK